MADPTTTNVALIVPNTGADVGTWGAVAINPDMVAIDGLFGGVATVGLTNLNVTLSAPSGAITPSAGPNQAQNAVIKLTGALTGNVTITLPLPGLITIDNQCTGAFVVSFRAIAATQVIAIPQGAIAHIYNDGANVRFVNGIGENPGKQEFWAGLSAIPAWVAACTVRPYLYCDGSVYNFSDYPALAARLVGTFGGNGVTTFGVPDHRGRVPLAYDGTGTRITVAGCGLNGQILGAAIDTQSVTLAANQIPAGVISVNAAQAITVSSTSDPNSPAIIRNAAFSSANIAGGASFLGLLNSAGNIGSVTSSGNNSISVASTNASQQVVANVQPVQVAGIWVVKT